MNLFSCPVCGFDQMPDPPQDYTICSCCGTEFGLDDVGESHASLRSKWIAKGAPWFSDELEPPNLWNPFEQLVRADLDFDENVVPTSATNQLEKLWAIA